MPKGKRVFSKSNSVTYRLVPAERSDDENAPKNILVPVTNRRKKAGLFPFPQLVNLGKDAHIETASVTSKKNAELDPEIRAALEGDFDFSDPENLLDDDFIMKANTNNKSLMEPLDEEDEEEFFSNDSDGEKLKESNKHISSKKGKSLSTNSKSEYLDIDHEENLKMLSKKFEEMLNSYDIEQSKESLEPGKKHVLETFIKSQSSNLFDSDISEDESIDLNSNFSNEENADARINRTKHTRRSGKSSELIHPASEMTDLDERFEKILEEYDDDQIGALDFEDLDNSQFTDSYVTEKLLELKNQKSDDKENANFVLESCDEEMKKKILEYASIEKRIEFEEIVTEKPIEFDCESILSTYSSIYNHPTVIKSDSIISTKLNKRRLTRRNLKELEEQNKIEEESEDDSSDDIKSTISSARPKNETPEERRMRKKVIKEVRRENRKIKKENKLAFKQEKQKQELQQINLRQNAGIKIV